LGDCAATRLLSSPCRMFVGAMEALTPPEGKWALPHAMPARTLLRHGAPVFLIAGLVHYRVEGRVSR
jgi:hypothetical protein